MKKALKIGLASFFGLVIVLGVVLFFLAKQALEPDKLKDRAQTMVKEQTGRDLDITGDVSVSIFPWIGAEIGALTLSNRPGFGDEPFLQAKETGVVVKLIPLFKGDVQIKRLELNGLRLNLMRNAKGATNWGDLTEKHEATAKSEEPSGQGEEDFLKKYAIGGVNIQDAWVSWEDEKEGVTYAIEGLNLKTGAIVQGKAFDLDFSTSFKASKPEASGKVSLTGQAYFDPDRMTVSIEDMNLNTDLSGPGSPMGDLSAKVVGDVSANMDAETYKAEGLALTMTAEGDEVPGGKLMAGLSAKEFALDLKKQTLTLAELSAQANEIVTVKGSLSGKSVVDAPSLSGTISVPEFDLGAFLASIGQEVKTANTDALKRVSADFDLAATDNSASLSGLLIKLDGTTIDGNAAVTSFDPAAYKFSLKADALNLDDYLPPASKDGGSGAGGGKGSSGGSEEIIPVETLRGLRVDGDLNVGRLVLSNMKMENVVVSIRAGGGIVSIKPVKVNMYQGAVAGAVLVDAAKSTPRTSVDLSVSGLEAGPMLKDATGEDSLQGTVNLSANMAASGAASTAMKKSLSGKADLSIKDGVFPGVDFLDLAKSAALKAKGQGNTIKEGESTKFGELSATVNAKNGLLSNKDFLMKAPAMRVAGEGTADLPTEKIDYAVLVKLTSDLEGQGGQSLADVYGLPIPIHVGGTFSDPTYIPDIPALAAAIAKGVVFGTAEGATNVLEDVGSGVGKMLGIQPKEESSTTKDTSTSTQEESKPKNPIDEVINLFQ